MESIYEVAKYFLSKDSMTHKKLQKLCYYAQAWYLANHGCALVQNRFEAWAHGPVCPDLYVIYRGWGWEEIPQVSSDRVDISDDVKVFLNIVFDTYGSYTADELERITHTELPWQNARKGYPAGAYSRNPISQIDMRDYYGERIDKQYDCK